MKSISRRNAAIVGVLVLDAVVVSAATYFATKKKLNQEFDERLDREVKASVEFELSQLGVLVSDDEFEQPTEMPATDSMEDPDISVPEETREPVLDEDLEPTGGERVFPGQDKPTLEELAQKNQTTQYHSVLEGADYGPTVEQPAEPVVTTPEDVWDPGEEISVISRDLYETNVSGFQQEVYTFFAGDKQLLSIMGDVVENQEQYIGTGIPPFGQQSDDSNAVYLRNRKLGQECEVIRDPGKASDFLHASNGFVPPENEVTDELKHSLHQHFGGPGYNR